MTTFFAIFFEDLFIYLGGVGGRGKGRGKISSRLPAERGAQAGLDPMNPRS